MSANRPDRGYYRRGSLVWPIVLIGLGILFLLNNLGIISWDVWTLMIRMWPVLIIAVGLDLLLGRRSGIGAAITAILIIGLFAGFFWFLNFSGEVWSGDQIAEPIVYETGRGTEADVNIDINIGELYIESLDADTDLFVDGEVIIGEDERLINTFEVNNGVIDFSLSSKGQQYYPDWLFTDGLTSGKTWNLAFSPDVLLDLGIDSGVGKTDLDLTDLSLTSLEIDGGVGEVFVTLPDEGNYEVNISAGVGRIEVRVPEGIAARIYINTGLGNTSVIGDYTQTGNVYMSDDFETADHTANLYLDGGVGNIRVVEVGD